MVNVLPFVARKPSLSTLKNVANRMLSVVVAALRLLTNVSGTEPEKVNCIDLLAVPLGHVPTIDSLKNKVLFSLNTTILLLTVSKNGDNVPDGQIASWVNAINEKLMSAGLGKIEVKIDSNGVKKFISGGEEAKASWKDAARAVQSVGGALAGIEDPATKVAGTIAQAIAEIALSFASALNKKESQAGGVWGWIAAAAAGTATMIATIASIKSATRHAAGGIVPGNTPSGDLRPVLLNSGELVLNRAQQGNLAEQLQDSRHAQDNAAMPYVTGEMIYLGLSNHLRRLGRGEIVTTRG